MRALIAAVALLILPSLALAQSDTRKVAIFTYNKNASNVGSVPGPYSADGSSAALASEVYYLAETALRRMGVPYTVFNYADSAGGWASTMGATRPAGTADSTWFRQNGYFMTLHCLGDMSSTDSVVPFTYFTDGRLRGLQYASPMGGTWGIPGLAFIGFTDNNAGAAFVNGAAVTTDGVPGTWQNFFANGDTLAGATLFSGTWVKQPHQADSVTVIVAQGDTVSGGSRMRAWRWKSSFYYYPTSSPTFANSWILLGLAQVFDVAGYKPRRKLNLHWTLDHLYAEGVDGHTAPTDSFLVYARAAGWRPSIQHKAHGVSDNDSEYALSESAIRSLMDQWVRDYRLPVTPHSHVTRVGNWGQGSGWDLSAYSDSALMRQRWNFMEQAISDTLNLPQGSGHERTIGFPGDWVRYPQLYIVAQNRYTDIRAPQLDSIGVRPNVSLHAYQRVLSGPSSGRGTGLPWRWTEPGTGRNIWVHGLYTYPTGDDTLWVNMDGLSGSNTLQAYTQNHMNAMTRAIVHDTDYYWHPNENLETSRASTNRPMNLYMRRKTYFMNRVKNIVDVQPYYRPKYPRMSSISRD